MFRTNQPVTDLAFFDRDREANQLMTLIAELEAGAPSWLAIFGPRKIGKTSLILECARRSTQGRVRIAAIDTMEHSPVSLEFFRRYALRVLDALFASELGESPEALAQDPSAYRAALMDAPRFAALDAARRRFLFELPEAAIDPAFIRACLELPEQLASALDAPILIAIDEFQELAVLTQKRGGIEPYAMMRSAWQKHRHTAYVISGSARTMLERLVTAKTSPFFQHFTLMELGPLPTSAAVRLLVESSAGHRAIPSDLAESAVRVLGTRPFYLQMLGDSVVRTEPPYDRATLKGVLQDLLFSRTGRLSLYFENEYERLVGKSTTLAATLDGLARGPLRLVDLARAVGAPSGQVSGYLERLGDAVRRRADGRYELEDETFTLWLSWRRPGGSVVPMGVLGDQAEKVVAEHLARSGFELVYQSRGSRGAFDLLATRGAQQLGVQVKRSALPLRFTREAWSRMTADAKRLGWRWIVAAVSPAERVSLLDPAGVVRGRGVALPAAAEIENIVTWVDPPPATVAPKRKGARAGRGRTTPRR